MFVLSEVNGNAQYAVFRLVSSVLRAIEKPCLILNCVRLHVETIIKPLDI